MGRSSAGVRRCNRSAIQTVLAPAKGKSESGAIAEVKGEGAPHRIQEGDWVTKGTVLAIVRESDFQQGLSPRQLRADELFHASTHETVKV